ncbi:RHS repeat-associated core domain-containing protein, partial [Streptomyces sp. NPDC058733]|uniref:RHS repeat-associated core domain-containing protein n=1 Tax=Streptomyces sp. NPDC058733 TaxID=3346614 RepID=UPI0036CBEA92
TRNVDGLDGNLVATTTDSGDTVLQLANLHGDIALQLPADSSVAPTVLDYDEYGNPRTGQSAGRYDWLGAKERSSETPTGLTLMGVRLYNPSTGRFLSVDPVPGGNANAYDYCHADPVNCFDLTGKWSWRHYLHRLHRRAHHWLRRHPMVRRVYYGYNRWAGRVYRNHYFRACTVWGGGGAGAIITYGFWAGPIDWGLAGVTGAFGCASGMIGYRWN